MSQRYQNRRWVSSCSQLDTLNAVFRDTWYVTMADLSHIGVSTWDSRTVENSAKMEMTRPWVLLFGCGTTKCSFWEPRPWV